MCRVLPMHYRSFCSNAQAAPCFPGEKGAKKVKIAVNKKLRLRPDVFLKVIAKKTFGVASLTLEFAKVLSQLQEVFRVFHPAKVFQKLWQFLGCQEKPSCLTGLQRALNILGKISLLVHDL